MIFVLKQEVFKVNFIFTSLTFSYISFLQLLVNIFQHALLVHLHALGEVIYVRQLLTELQVLQGEICHLGGGVLLLLLQSFYPLLQGPVGLLQVLDL